MDILWHWRKLPPISPKNQIFRSISHKSNCFFFHYFLMLRMFARNQEGLIFVGCLSIRLFTYFITLDFLIISFSKRIYGYPMPHEETFLLTHQKLNFRFVTIISSSFHAAHVCKNIEMTNICQFFI